MGFMHFNTWNLSHLKNQILVKKKEQPRKKIVTGTKEQFAFIENKCKIHTPNEQKWINAYLECFNSVIKADVVRNTGRLYCISWIKEYTSVPYIGGISVRYK